ncbi:Leucine-, isoleucine-, valine-, threonine-, and alanine-binding protein precursor [Pelotomaculum sp. FP]|uniref:ABC transporter substrate-binding protein n=1 Tax=Pelotomaculum sp. FP TaxID=261474 RepID=UPI001065C53D|nr:ABC transporter substrate-binding protein [Pelotomaculum sp. FP]TEB17155.1 Leucine-, isoleucine-, valine-, threonine-, and alanine-binding protein precursor [Pelotomaculum sp. FP]
MLTNKRILVLMILVLGLALVLTGCGGDNKATSTGEKVIKIGFIGPLTGDVKTFGESTKNGFLLALEQAGNKVGDYKIEYVTADDRNDATEAVNVATKLIAEDRVKAIVGSVTSKTTIAASQLANDNKVVMISGTGTSPKVTVDNDKRKDFIFRACFIDPFQGTVAAKFATETLKAKTAAILYDQGNDYTIGLSNFFKEQFTKNGGQILAMEAYAQGDVDFSAVLTNIAKQKPDILYLPDYYQKVSLIGKQAREKGINAIFLGGDGWDSTELDYKTMEGGYFTSHYSPDDPRPEVKTWVDSYKNKYNAVPDAFATLGYDATNLLLNAIKTANSDDPAKIKDALQASKEFAAVTGKLTFDKDGNPIKPAVILQIKDGKQSYVTTVTP